MKKVIALAAVLFVFLGCASAVPKLDPGAVDSIRKGTTKSQVFDLFGTPDKARDTENGDVIWSYIYVATTPNPIAASPVKSASSTSANTQQQSLIITFGPDGVVKDVVKGHADAKANTNVSPHGKVDTPNIRGTGH